MATRDGTWRPDKPFSSADGLKVTLRRAANLTPSGILKVPFRFQVPPIGELRRAYQFNWATFDTIADGQHSRPMGAQLLQVQVQTLLMDAVAANASSGVVVWTGRADPQRMIKELRYIAGVDDDRKGKAAPFRLTITQQAVWDEPVVSMIATLTSVEPTQQNGEVGTEYLSLTFLEYPERSSGRQRRNHRPARKHKLADEDTLYGLAKRYLHQASAWKRIANANGISGVSADSAAELAAWAKRHHKTSLTIPQVAMKDIGTFGVAKAALEEL